ncbi:YtnP family quorum-quenching lactonase [Mangrovibacillus cuniculi]|uniref:MBL fold metallo-hydrolase n=1 Tax=Mangrovibacillus cuniculi TaxID=2593652 RepID=A0A7S8HG02_9BACI|nr:MBL fold metallo-hydrolase [Mangrovibacillus cuniculi]QPC47272.1 MBL fold metallo-hydrolase [Mangrovibacillus cuniculi]
MEKLHIGKFAVTWLRGGITQMDGGAMFGVVPKPLWSKKYPHNEKNQIPLRTDPLLIQVEGKNILLEAGIGNDLLTEKQQRNYGVSEESLVEQDLTSLGLTPNDIDIVCMTHVHFDHVLGLSKMQGGTRTSMFPNAEIYISEVEWNEMQNPNIRSRNTYWEENYRPIEKQVKTFKEEITIVEGLKMTHTGGHSNGHSVVTISSEGEHLIHMGDLMPTHAHFSPLWVLAYDDYPMTSIEQKQRFIQPQIEKDAWFTFYHDAVFRAVKFSSDGTIQESIKRE